MSSSQFNYHYLALICRKKKTLLLQLPFDIFLNSRKCPIQNCQDSWAIALYINIQVDLQKYNKLKKKFNRDENIKKIVSHY